MPVAAWEYARTVQNPLQRPLARLDDPRIMRRLNGWLTVFWVAAIPVSWAFGWLRSVVYVSALSLWALVAGHLSTWQAARVEVRQELERRKALADPIEDRVVRRLEQEGLDPGTVTDTPRSRFW